ncbi:MAG: hypothetical protein ACLSE8_06780 [Parasutterella sp.]
MPTLDNYLPTAIVFLMLAMKKELQTAQAAEILSALRKSGRSYEELMTFLKAKVRVGVTDLSVRNPEKFRN